MRYVIFININLTNDEYENPTTPPDRIQWIPCTTLNDEQPGTDDRQAQMATSNPITRPAASMDIGTSWHIQATKKTHILSERRPARRIKNPTNTLPQQDPINTLHHTGRRTTWHRWSPNADCHIKSNHASSSTMHIWTFWHIQATKKLECSAHANLHGA